MRTIWDISRPLTNDLAPWPGDTPFRYELKWSLSETCSVNVGAVSMSMHNGTHADAPFHFSRKVDTIDCVPLENYIGPAVVIDLAEKFSRTQPFVAIADLKHARSQIAETRRETVHGEAVGADIAQRLEAVGLSRLLGAKLFENDDVRALFLSDASHKLVQQAQHGLWIGAGSDAQVAFAGGNRAAAEDNMDLQEAGP